MKIRVRLPLLLAASILSLFAQKPTITGVDNGFSFKSAISPGVLASIFGSNLSGNNLEVTIGGLQCPVTYSSASQLNIQIPWEVATGKRSVVVEHDSLSSTPFAVTVTQYSPALVSDDGSGSGLGEFFTPNGTLITTTNLANAGDTLTTYAIGLGDTTPASTTGVDTPAPPPLYTTLATPAIVVGGESAALLFSGMAPGALATVQLNFTLATNTPVGTETVAVTVGTASTRLITIPIGCEDVTTGVSVSKGPLKKVSEGKYSQKVTITNTSGKQLAAKGSMVLSALTSTATLTNGGGASCPSSDGSPFKSFSFTGTGDAQTATFALDFTDTSTGTITYGQRVLDK
jgi:uncharacterized protein (TIGR03437 family)